MKLVKEHINEKFTEDSDPVQDMGIGVVSKYKDFVKRISLRYSNVTESATRLLRFLIEDEKLSAADIILLIKYIIIRYRIKHISKLSSNMLNNSIFLNDKEKAYVISKFIINNYDINFNSLSGDFLFDVLENNIYNNEIAELLLKKGLDINQNNGESLNNAIDYGEDTTVKWLLDHGAKCAVKDYGILKIALDNDNYEIVERCIKEHYEEKYNK